MSDVQIGDLWCEKAREAAGFPLGRWDVTDVQTINGTEWVSLQSAYGKQAGARLRLTSAALKEQFVLKARMEAPQ